MKWASSSVWGSKHSIVPPIPPPPKVCLLPPQRIPHQIPLIKQLLFSSGIKGNEREWLISVVTITTNRHYKALAGIFKYGNQKLSTMVWGVQFAAPFFFSCFFLKYIFLSIWIQCWSTSGFLVNWNFWRVPKSPLVLPLPRPPVLLTHRAGSVFFLYALFCF